MDGHLPPGDLCDLGSNHIREGWKGMNTGNRHKVCSNHHVFFGYPPVIKHGNERVTISIGDFPIDTVDFQVPRLIIRGCPNKMGSVGA